MAALGTFAPGYYSMTYGGLDCGLVEGVRQLRRRFSAQQIQTDVYGDSDVDGVYRGGNTFLMMTFKEWKAPISTTILNPYHVTDIGAMGLNGRLQTDLSAVIILTATASTPAATAGPVTLTASKAILAPDNDVEWLMGNEQRDVSVLFQLYPYDDSGTIRWFSVT